MEKDEAKWLGSKLQRRSENVCDVVARKVAEGSTNIKRQLFSALLFVIVVGCALRINACTILLDL